MANPTIPCSLNGVLKTLSGAKIFRKVHATAEHASEGYIFTKGEGAFVGSEGVVEGAVDGLEKVLAGRSGFREGRVGLKGGRGVVKEGVRAIIDRDIQTGV